MQVQSQKRIHPSTPDVGRIHDAATSAKARGETAVQLPSAIIMPTGVASVDEVLSIYSVMLLKLSQIVVSDDPHSIFTWYKFKILDTLTRQKEVSKDTLPENVLKNCFPWQTMNSC
jgi:hypothetical protein